jgi:outer membrane protein OmpA-like peptidoglycan-associated protein
VVLLSSGVSFQWRSSVPRPDQDAFLVQVADALPVVTNLRLEIEGHADPGEGKSGDRLAEQRARVVYDRLVMLGLPKERLVLKVAGTKNPAVPHGSARAREANPRVTLRLVE